MIIQEQEIVGLKDKFGMANDIEKSVIFFISLLQKWRKGANSSCITRASINKNIKP